MLLPMSKSIHRVISEPESNLSPSQQTESLQMRQYKFAYPLFCAHKTKREKSYDKYDFCTVLEELKAIADARLSL